MENGPVPYTVHESDMARMERSNRRLTYALAIVSVVAVLVIALCVVLLYRSNVKWVEAWSSYDYESEEISVDTGGGGNAQYIGSSASYTEGNGDRYYGQSDSQEKETD